jgi:hypothetical protein
MQGKDKDFFRKQVLDEYYPNWSGLTYEGLNQDMALMKHASRLFLRHLSVSWKARTMKTA